MRRSAAPLIAFILLAIASTLHWGSDPVRSGQTWPEIASHHLGHEINSIWVGVSLLILVVPSLRAIRLHARPAWAWRALDAIALDFLVVDALCRRFLPWPRPFSPDRAGFPSGHTMFAFLMAWLVAERYPRLGPWWFAIAAIIGWSRVVVNAHFPYQVIFGAIFGCAIGWLVVHREDGVLLPRIILPAASRRGGSSRAKSSDL